jgi:hypothetical protein
LSLVQHHRLSLLETALQQQQQFNEQLQRQLQQLQEQREQQQQLMEQLQHLQLQQQQELRQIQERLRIHQTLIDDLWDWRAGVSD